MNTSTPTSCKKSLLVFQTHLNGHLIEYINHLFNSFCKNKNLRVCFVMPKDENKFKLLNWETSSSCCIDYLSEHERTKCNNSPYFKCKTLLKYINTNKYTDVLLLTSHDYQPWLNFSFPNIRIHIMIYNIFLYEWKNLNLRRRIVKYLLMNSLVKNGSIATIMLCNDYVAARKYNQLFHTEKFRAFPDPCIISDIEQTDLPPNSSSILKFIHIGAMSKRKGTLQILEAINLLPRELVYNSQWIFAGKIDSSIKKEFYSLLENNSNQDRITVYDEFCSFEQLKHLCITSNYLLMPYSACSQSSGMFGYASLFNIPLVVTNKGIFRRIVNKYKLGYALDDTSVDSLRNFFIKALSRSLPKFEVSTKYRDTHTIEHFTSEVLSIMNCK